MMTMILMDPAVEQDLFWVPESPVQHWKLHCWQAANAATLLRKIQLHILVTLDLKIQPHHSHSLPLYRKHLWRQNGCQQQFQCNNSLWSLDRAPTSSTSLTTTIALVDRSSATADRRNLDARFLLDTTGDCCRILFSLFRRRSSSWVRSTFVWLRSGSCKLDTRPPCPPQYCCCCCCIIIIVTKKKKKKNLRQIPPRNDFRSNAITNQCIYLQKRGKENHDDPKTQHSQNERILQKNSESLTTWDEEQRRRMEGGMEQKFRHEPHWTKDHTIIHFFVESLSSPYATRFFVCNKEVESSKSSWPSSWNSQKKRSKSVKKTNANFLISRSRTTCKLFFFFFSHYVFLCSSRVCVFGGSGKNVSDYELKDSIFMDEILRPCFMNDSFFQSTMAPHGA